jgi:hypothetical protein
LCLRGFLEEFCVVLVGFCYPPDASLPLVLELPEGLLALSVSLLEPRDFLLLCNLQQVIRVSFFAISHSDPSCSRWPFTTSLTNSATPFRPETF